MSDQLNREPLRVLVFSASMRADSINTRLAREAADQVDANGASADLSSMAEFACPPYDNDVEREAGFPPPAEAFKTRIEAANGVVIASPEYNASMPGVLKNAIDWVSRYRPQPFNELHVLLLSASPSMIGGNRGLWALRIPLEHLGARVYPDMFSLAQAHNALSPEGSIVNQQLSQRFADTIAGFLDLVEASTHYPCVKRAWIEFLGERPTEGADRVDDI